MTKRKTTFAQRLQYLLLQQFIKLLKLLPYHTAESFTSWLFMAAGISFNIRKKLAMKQLEQVFPQKDLQQRKQIVRNMYLHFGRVSADMFLNGSLEEKKINISGWENITNALRLGRGLLFISGHIGNWELAGRVIASRGIPISVVIKRIHNGLVNNHINKIREANGIKIIYKKRALRPTLTAFKNNEAVVTLIDQDARKDGYKLNFLGKEGSLHTAFVRLAMKYDTPIVFGAALVNNDGSYNFIFDKPVIPSEFTVNDTDTTPETSAKEIAIAKHFHNRLEYYVKQYPEQWFWMHNRWKGIKKAKPLPTQTN